VSHAAVSRAVLRAAALLAAGLLAACGSARRVADDRPLCQRCHGGANGNEAPPVAVDGATATTDPGVGAHQAHLVAGRLRGPIACGECHQVPADVTSHVNGKAELSWGALTTTDGAGPSFGAGRCANTYCHGGNLGHGGSLKDPEWTRVDGTQAACGTCHGNPPPSHDAGATQCSDCHSGTVNADGTIRFAPDATSLHIDGHHDVPSGGGCTACHAAPPATGAHLAHGAIDDGAYGSTRFLQAAFPAITDPTDPQVAAYQFGCGNCHPISSASHRNGTWGDIDLSPAGAPAGSLKALNDAGAAWDDVTQTCTGVYCHSSGQAAPAYTTSPPWTGTFQVPRCAGCHANPPDYASGGAGAATANGHIGLLMDNGNTYETGHFAGFPAMFHAGSFHGGGATGSSPITCQTCHYGTVDPSNVAPSGFYYLDTTGDYDLGGSGGFCFGGTGPACAGGTITAAYACAQCHDGTTAPAGTGKVLPLLHVNGARDVAFDPRATRPGSPGRPYWYGPYGANAPKDYWAIGGDAFDDGTYLSLRLPAPPATPWNATTKTCSGIACHFHRTSLQWGEPLTQDSGTCNNTCAACHAFAQPGGCP